MSPDCCHVTMSRGARACRTRDMSCRRDLHEAPGGAQSDSTPSLLLKNKPGAYIYIYIYICVGGGTHDKIRLRPKKINH